MGGGGAGPGVALPQPTAMPVLFVNGQSNATALELPEATIYNGRDLLTWSHDGWVPARAERAGHRPLGIGAWAGRVMRSLLLAGGEVARVDNFGWPGKSIAYFLPNSTSVALIEGDYDPAMRNQYRVARDTWTASGVEPTLLVWSQGEADADTSSMLHFNELSSLLAAWWLDYPKLERVLLIKTAANACGRDTSGVRAAQELVAARDPRVVLVNVDDLTKVAEYHTGCHYTLAGYERIADHVLVHLE